MSFHPCCLCGFCLGGRLGWGWLSKNRSFGTSLWRFCSAIHGSANFWKATPNQARAWTPAFLMQSNDWCSLRGSLRLLRKCRRVRTGMRVSGIGALCFKVRSRIALHHQQVAEQAQGGAYGDDGGHDHGGAVVEVADEGAGGGGSGHLYEAEQGGC